MSFFFFILFLNLTFWKFSIYFQKTFSVSVGKNSTAFESKMKVLPCLIADLPGALRMTKAQKERSCSEDRKPRKQEPLQGSKTASM